MAMKLALATWFAGLWWGHCADRPDCTGTNKIEGAYCTTITDASQGKESYAAVANGVIYQCPWVDGKHCLSTSFCAKPQAINIPNVALSNCAAGQCSPGKAISNNNKCWENRFYDNQ
mmetsp:Transcript_101338/g.180124  ORF Transcript_101338/g.180124 Transcript_101338/m.180124 type:complete len:117 (+) Transcript_101338:57-407(+)